MVQELDNLVFRSLCILASKWNTYFGQCRSGATLVQKGGATLISALFIERVSLRIITHSLGSPDFSIRTPSADVLCVVGGFMAACVCVGQYLHDDWAIFFTHVPGEGLTLIVMDALSEEIVSREVGFRLGKNRLDPGVVMSAMAGLMFCLGHAAHRHWLQFVIGTLMFQRFARTNRHIVDSAVVHVLVNVCSLFGTYGVVLFLLTLLPYFAFEVSLILSARWHNQN